MTADQAWYSMVGKILDRGARTKPRKLTCLEIIGNKTVVDMVYPITTMRPRLGYKFLAAEAWWILSGRNDVASIEKYSSHISKFSDDGIRFFGAYGPKIVDQLGYAVQSIVSDEWTRQSVVSIWRENPRNSKDVPCTLSVQWLLRPHLDCLSVESNRLHCVVTMRSSDAWLGWPYDVFNFSMLSAYIALELQYRIGKTITLGNLHLTAGSQHLYEHPKIDGNFDIPCDLEDVKKIVNDCRQNGLIYSKPYAPINLSDFSSPTALLYHLSLCKDGVGVDPFMREFQK